jgi:uncharacterized protein involved in exopolysaccharide biosynthesis
VIPGQLPTIDMYVAAVWRRRWLLAVGGLIGVLVATAIFLSRPYTYTSTASVALAPQVTFVAQDPTDNKPTFVTLDTIAYLARSDKVVEPVAAAMGVSVPEARRSITVSAQPLSSVLRIHVRSTSRAAAQQGSRVAAEALVKEQRRALALKKSQIRLLRNRVSTLQSQAIGRSHEGADPSSIAADLDVMQQRLQEAVASNQQPSLVINRHEATANRPGQLEVFATAGLVAGMVLVSVAAALARPLTRRRRVGGTTR